MRAGEATNAVTSNGKFMLSRMWCCRVQTRGSAQRAQQAAAPTPLDETHAGRSLGSLEKRSLAAHGRRIV